MGRLRDFMGREELNRMLPVQSSFPDFAKYCERRDSSPSSSSNSSSADNALWNEDFSHRPSWCDAGLTYQQMKKGRARGNTCAICLRALLQRFLFRLGCFIQRHFAIVLCVGLLLLTVCSVGIGDASVETNIEKLWVEKGGRLTQEREFIRHVFSLQMQGLGALPDDGGLTGGGSSAQYLVLIQTPRQKGLDILNEEELLLHAQVLKNVSQLSVDMYGEKWTLADICFKPEAPPIESHFGDIVKHLLDRIIPCVVITPLDCFWEGSAPLGPFPPMVVPPDVTFFIRSLRGNLSWTNLDPLKVIDGAASVLAEVDSIKGLFVRAGIEDGYLSKPCIDPFDMECPHSAPNYGNICYVVEKYLLSRNLSSLVSSSMTTPPAAFVHANSSYQNVTANMTGNATATTASQADMDSGGLGWLFGAADDKEDEPTSKASISRDLCKEYSNEVRRHIRTDATFLTRMGVETAPVDFGQDLTGGCRGFAQNYMHWPEDLIVGGVKRQSDRIIRAEALQSVLMISSPTDVFHRFKEHGSYKSQLRLDKWSLEAADKVLKAWQRKYTDYIYNHTNNTGPEPRRLHPLAGTSVNDMLSEFSSFNPTVILVGYVLMVVYAAASLCSCAERGVRSSVGLAVAGCLMVTLASVAGLGLSMWIGVPFNAATTQIVPFLTLGLGVDDMFLLVHNYKEIVKFVHRDEIGFLLKETGLSALLTSINNIVAFLAGSVMPVPALRDFCLQVAILLFFNAITILTIYPAVMTIDLDRRKRRLVDVFCCVKVKNDKIQPKFSCVNVGSVDISREYENGELAHQTGNGDSGSLDGAMTHSSSPILGTATGGTANGGRYHVGNSVTPDNRQARYRITGSNSLRSKCGIQHWTLHRFVKDAYIPWLSKKRVKVIIMLFHCVLFSLGVIGFTRVSLGLELTDVIPKGTAPYAFLDAREAYFSFYPFNAVIKGPTDYSRKQRLLHNFRESIARISFVVKNNDGHLAEESWLVLMAKWLSSLQAKLDDDMQYGRITLSGMVKSESATAEGKLAYKLLCNRGDVVNCSRVGMTKLVDGDGLIDPDGFYNYITAWYHMDPMTYYISQADFYPTPPQWQNTEQMHNEEDFRIPPTQPMIYSQIPFFATNLVDTPATVDMIKQVRDVCDDYAAQGLPVFPEGIPFTFWEQYLHLWRHLGIALCIITGAVMIIVTLLLMNPWTAVIIVIVLALMVVELAGFMGLMGLKLNPVSSVTLITAVGIGVEFTVHVSLSFLTALGTRDERMGHTLEHMFIPVLHGGLSTLLGVIMLAFSEFEFVVRYFFMVLSALIVLGLVNGLMLLPVLLSLFGPRCEVRPTDGSNRLPPPTPPPARKPLPQTTPTMQTTNSAPNTPKFRRRGSGGRFTRQSDLSLSTIAEEQTPPSSVTPPVTVIAAPASIRGNTSDCSDGSHVRPMKILVPGGEKVRL